MRRMYMADNGNVSLKEEKIICNWNGRTAEFEKEQITHIALRELSEKKDGCLIIELNDRTMIHLHFKDAQEEDMTDLYECLQNDGNQKSKSKKYRKVLSTNDC